VAHDLELPEEPRHHLRQRRAAGQPPARDHRRQVRHPRLPGGEIVPGLQALDAVQQGTVEMCHSCSYYYVGKDKTFAFGTAVPFGMNARQMDAWIIGGGGQELLDEFYSNYNVYSFLAATPACRWAAGIARKIKTLEDIKGLKMRIAGIGWRDLSRMGASRSRSPAGHLPGAGEGHDRRRRMGRSLRRREARLLQGGQELLLAGLVGAGPACTST
jgi:hypothetical protein